MRFFDDLEEGRDIDPGVPIQGKLDHTEKLNHLVAVHDLCHPLIHALTDQALLAGLDVEEGPESSVPIFCPQLERGVDGILAIRKQGRP